MCSETQQLLRGTSSIFWHEKISLQEKKFSYCKICEGHVGVGWELWCILSSPFQAVIATAEIRTSAKKMEAEVQTFAMSVW